MENIFEKGCLVQLSVSQWGASKKIDKLKLAEMSANPEWLRASKKLVDPEALKPICKVAGAARAYLEGVSLPFPLHGMLFVPKELISRIDSRLEGYKAEFNQNLDVFIQQYERLREAAMLYLGDLFNEMDYPVDVRSKFSFYWRFIVLDVPNGHSGLLSPEVYEREKEKFVQTMEEAREMAVQSLREEFADMVERMSERFAPGQDGKPKVFKNSTIESFYEFFETFKERNIFRDSQLSELVDRAQSVLGGASADHIRSDQNLKDRIKAGMQNVEEAVAEIMNRPRRKIIMD